MHKTVKFRRTASVGPRCIPERLKSRRYEVKDETAEPRTVNVEKLAEICGGGRNTDFQQCLTVATRIATAGDRRWVCYPSIAVVDE